MRAPPQWHEDRNAGMDVAGAGSDHGLWKGRVLKRVDVFELRFAQIQCDTLPPLRSPERQEDVLCTKLHESGASTAPPTCSQFAAFSPSLLVIDDVHAPNVSCFSTYVGQSV